MPLWMNWISEESTVAVTIISVAIMLAAGVVIGAAIIAVHSMFYSSRNQIKGLTTAVGLWVAVIAGIALGMGCYTVGIAAFAALLCILFGFRRWNWRSITVQTILRFIWSLPTAFPCRILSP